MNHEKVKIPNLESRYLPPEGIASIMEAFSATFDIKTIGQSVEGRVIQRIRMGSGPIKVMIWSQMHGNETTTTRALLDLVNMLIAKKGKPKDWLDQMTIMAIPMLNPDGAQYYTRQNANEIDLNRDAQAQSQPETSVLFSMYEDFQPDFCFNLHDQRTRYAVGDTEVPSTLAFLAPAAEKSKAITPARKRAMKVIAGMHSTLRKTSDIGISRYEDEYNSQCVGDTFSSRGTTTILFEAGHYPGDYQRQITRRYIFDSLFCALDLIADSRLEQIDHAAYFDIPENKTSFADIILLNKIVDDSMTNFPLNYEEQLVKGKITFVPKPIAESYAASYYGHSTYDLQDENDVKTLRTDSTLSEFI